MGDREKTLGKRWMGVGGGRGESWWWEPPGQGMGFLGKRQGLLGKEVRFLVKRWALLSQKMG